MVIAATKEQPEPDQVLAKAFFNAAQLLGLSQSELANVLGLHRTGITRLKKKQSLDPNSKGGELALLFVRMSRALYALAGGDRQWMHHFMRSENHITGGIPAEQIQTIQGLVTVVQYVDAIRGKV